MRRVLALLMTVLMVAGCRTAPARSTGATPPAAGGSPATTDAGTGAPLTSSQPPSVSLPNQVAPSDQEADQSVVAITVSGHRFEIRTDSGVDPNRVLVAPGPEGFYWALPQPSQRPTGGGIALPAAPAVIYYTPYSQTGPIDLARAQMVYHLPLKDIFHTGASPGALMLSGLALHGPWLFYQYDSIVPGTAQPAYTAIGVLDTRTPYLSARFLFRGGRSGGRFLHWVASLDYVVWQQGVTAGPGLQVITNLYDLASGRQQALPLPADRMADLVLDGNLLRYKDAEGTHTLPLPVPGSGKLAEGARALPAPAFGEVAALLRSGFGGKVYLPGIIAPQPFYIVKHSVSSDHYQVDFSGSDHPVPVNATREEENSLGPGPSLARMLGMVEAYTGDAPPPGAKQAAAPLPPGETFPMQWGDRTVEGHFVQPKEGSLPVVWWQDGNWRYQMDSYSFLWKGPSDRDLQRDLADVLKELPARGGPVPGAIGGEVAVGFAGDHRSTNVWFHLAGEWLHLGGYHFDALQGARDLVGLPPSGT